MKIGDIIYMPYTPSILDKVKMFFGYKPPEFKPYRVVSDATVDHIAVKIEETDAPKCFGSSPSHQAQAENDCELCMYQSECLGVSK